jgi:hypothetical protein
MQRKLLEMLNACLNVTGQLMIVCSAFVKYMTKICEHNEAVHQLFMDFKYNLVRREVLHNILTEYEERRPTRCNN